MLGELITSKTRLRLLIKFFISQANKGYLNGLATEMGESTNAIRKELNHLQGAGYLDKIKVDNKVEDVLAHEDKALEKTRLLPKTEGVSIACSFGHIFAGGYSAGYYSYKWAEVLSSDAFAAFEEAGLSNKDEVRKIGKKYRDSILSLGGSRSPNQVFKKFRGRLPSTKALIRHSGLD